MVREGEQVAGRSTVTEFVAKARAKHGDRYDYSLVEYVNSQTKVTIVCPEHGKFDQAPAKHLFGQGCASCGGRDRLTSEEFIDRSRAVHGTKYDYSLVVYENNRRKVAIACPDHGAFQQAPGEHMAGQGCPTCARRERGLARRGTTEDFVSRAVKLHGAKYDYSKVQYIDSQTKVTIVCATHGPFEQSPGSHLKGVGCPPCGVAKRSIRLALSTEEFVRRARDVHGERYDYSQVEYVRSQVKVTIGCREHGPFEQTPNSHLSGQGCPTCGQEAITRAMTDTAESFIVKALRVHGERYDYSQVEYVRSQVNVTIGCREHGPFQQMPNSHLCGSGCPVCRNISISIAQAGSTEDFLDRASVVHGSRFDYSKTVFAGSHIKSTIICRAHGEFEQTPASHLNGSGCPACATEARRLAIAGTSDEFVTRAQTVHGDKYDYSEVDYRNATVKVTILCPRHGRFSQLPPVHLRGAGCPRCSISRGEAAVARFLTARGIEYEHQWRDHDCRDKGILAFDFALLEHRVLIEFDGEQHSRPVRWGSMTHDEAEAIYRGVQRRDGIKDAWARANGWTMVRLTDATTVEDALSAFFAGRA